MIKLVFKQKYITKKYLFSIVLLFFTTLLYSQTTYTWIGPDGDGLSSGAWNVAANWSENEVPPSSINSIIDFNSGGVFSVTDIPTTDIRKLLVTNNTDVTLQSNSTFVRYIYVRGPAGEVNLLIEDGSTLQISETNNLFIRANTPTGQIFDISGHLNVRGGTFSTSLASTNTTVSATGVINHYGGTVTGSTATLEFEENAIYNYMATTQSLTVPTATWHPKSYLYFPEITTGSPSVSATSEAAGLGTVIWDAPSQSDDIVFSNNTVHILGDFIIKNTGTDNLSLANTGTRYIYLYGDLIIEGGSLFMNTHLSSRTYLYISGNFNQSGGNFERGSSTGIQHINFNSDNEEKTFEQTVGTFDAEGIDFYVQTDAIISLESNFEIANGRNLYVYGQLNLKNDLLSTGRLYSYASGEVFLLDNINSECQIDIRGTMHFYDKMLTGDNTFNLGLGAFLYTQHAEGIAQTGDATGSIQVSGTRTYHTGANYIYNGTLAQTTGNALPATMNSLTIDNPAGVTLTTNNKIISTSLVLNQGLFDINNFDVRLITNAIIEGNPLNNSNMVVADGSGFLLKTFSSGGAPEFIFPIGDKNGVAEYSPVKITLNYNAAGNIGVRVVNDEHPENAGATDYLSRYFVFTTSMSYYNYQLNFDYTNDDINGSEANMLYSRWNGTQWIPYESNVSANNVNVTSVLSESNAPLTEINSYTAREGTLMYYRSVQTGDWDDISTWEVSSDPDFIAPAPTPAIEVPSAENSIRVTVQAAHTVTITGADLNTTINELVVFGDLENTTTGNSQNFLSGTISFEDGSNYYHNKNSGYIPVADWHINSTCNITGIVNTNPRYNTTLPFNVSNLVWDNPNQTSTGRIWTPNEVNIAGNLSVLNGTLNFSNLTYSVAGDVTNNATIHSSTGTLNMNGTTQQTISGNGVWTTGTAGRLYDLVIDNQEGVEMNCNFAIQRYLTMQNGQLSGTGTLTFGIGSSTLDCYLYEGTFAPTLNVDYNLNGVTYNLRYEERSGVHNTAQELPPPSVFDYRAGTLFINNPEANGGVVLSDDANISSINVSAGSFFDLNGKTLSVYGGSFTNSGRIDASHQDATIAFIGISNISMTGSMTANYSNNYVSNLIVDNNAIVYYNSALQIGSPIISGVLTLKSGVFHHYSQNLHIYGNVATTNGTMTKTGGELRFLGSVGNVGIINFTNQTATITTLEMNETGVNPQVTLNGNITLSQPFILTSGVVNMGQYLVNYTSTGNTPMLIANQNSSSYFKFNGASAGLKWTTNSVAAGTYRFPIGPSSVSGWRPITIQTTAAASSPSSIMLGFTDLIAGTEYTSYDIKNAGNIRSDYIANFEVQGNIGTPNITMEYQNSDFNAVPTTGNVQIWYYGTNPSSCWTTTGAQTSNGTNGANTTIVKNTAIALTSSGSYPLSLGETNNHSIEGCNPQTYIWNGSATTAWENPANWTPNPGAGNYPGFNGASLDLRNVNVLIPQTTSNRYPVVLATTSLFLNDITINYVPAYNTLTLAGAGTMTVAGNFINNNYARTTSITYTTTGSKIIYTGTSKIVAPGNFWDIDISATTTPILSPNGEIRINNEFNPGLVVPTNDNSTIAFYKNDLQDVPGFDYYNIEIWGTAGVTRKKTVLDDIVIDGYLLIGATRYLDDNGFTVNVKGDVYNYGYHIGDGQILLTDKLSAHNLYGDGNSDFYSNLTLNNPNGANVQNTFTINGELNLINGVFKLGNNYTTTLNGTFTRTNGFLSGYENTSILNITGAGILGTLFFENGHENLNNFSVNRGTSGELSLGTDLYIHNTLTLSAGLVKLGNSDLTLGVNAIVAGSHNNTRMVVADANQGNGMMKKVFNHNFVQNFTFPIGDITGTNDYSPIELINFKPIGANRTIGVNVTNAEHPNMHDQIQTDYLNRYWTFSDDAAGSGYAFTGMRMSYPSSDVEGTINTDRVQFNRHDGSDWHFLLDITQATSTTATTTAETVYDNVLTPLNSNDYTLRFLVPGPYTWNGSIDDDWQKPGNWTPTRIVVYPTDVLMFTDGGTYTVRNVPTETISRILFENNTNVTLEAVDNNTLTLAGFDGNDNLKIEAGASLQLGSGTNNLELRFLTNNAQIANIEGTLIVAENSQFSSGIAGTLVNVAATGEIILKENGNYNATNTITTVNGAFTRYAGSNGTITSNTTTLRFQDGSFFNHQTDGSIVPIASWDVNSTVDVTGITSTIATGFTQNLGNLIWNCTNQLSEIGLSNGTVNIHGDFTIESTGTDYLNLGYTGNRTINVYGDFILNNGDVNFNNDGTTRYTYLYVAGNFLHNGGSLQRGNTTGIQRIYFNSDNENRQYNKSGGIFNPEGIDFYVQPNAIITLESDIEVADGRSFYVQGNGTLYMKNNLLGLGRFYINNNGNSHLIESIELHCNYENRGNTYLYDNIITGTGDFINANTWTANLYIGHAQGIAENGEFTGNIQVTGNRTFSTGACYIYDGLIAQLTGTGLTQARDLTIDNSSGVSLTQNVTVSGTLYLIAGLFEMDDSDLRLTNTNNSTAVDGNPSASNMIVTNGTGQLRKYFSSNSTVEFEFPVGDNLGAVEYSPAYIQFNTNGAGDVGIKLTNQTHPHIAPSPDYLNRYWSFTTTMSSYDYNLRLDYIDPADIVGDITNTTVSRWDGSVWTPYDSNISGGSMEITVAPLTPITCPLSHSDFTARITEEICEENNGLLYETFPTSSLPTGWARGRIQGSHDWVIKESPGLSSISGGFYAVFDDWALGTGTTPNEAWIRTRPIDFCDLSSIKLSYYEYWYAVENTFGYVEISTDNGNTWTVIHTNSTTTVGSLDAPEQTVIDLTPHLTGYTTVMVRYRYLEEGAVGRYWYIDDINIFAGNDVGIAELVNPPYLDCETKLIYTDNEQVTFRVYNYSFEDVYNIDWTCHISGGYTGTYSGTVAYIPSNNYVDVNVATIDMSADDVYHFVLSAQPQAPEVDGNLHNNTLYEGRRQLVQTYPYFEDFNTTRAGWRQEGPEHEPTNSGVGNHRGREFAWGQLPYLGGAEGEGNSWYVKTTTNGQNVFIWAESPIFDFSELNNPVLSMDIKYQLFYNYHYSPHFIVEYSINNGENWYRIGNDEIQPWYNQSTSWNDNHDNPVDMWTHVEHQLCKLSGESCVKFRIYGRAYYGISGSNDYRSRNYFAFDNFRISAGDPMDIEPIAISLPNSRSCSSFSVNEEVQVIIKNNSCRPIENVPVSLQLNGGVVIDDVALGPIEPFQTYLHTFTTTVDMSVVGEHILTVSTNLPGDLIPENDILTETRINQSTVINAGNFYSQNFNSGNDGWVSTVNHETDGTRYFRLGDLPYLNGPEGEGDSWYVETVIDANIKYFSLESPVFDFSTATDPLLIMDLKYQLYQQSNRAIFRVEYSTNGGSNWTQLGTSASPEWYQGDTNWWTSNHDDPVDEWTQFQHSLCELTGEPCVKLRIYGRAYWGPQPDNNNLIQQPDLSERNYFAVDNVRIIDAVDVEVVAIVEPDENVTGCLYDQDQHITIIVHNHSCGEVFNVPVFCSINLPPGHPDFASSPLLFSGFVPSIPPSSSVSYTFSSTFDMTPMGVYNFDAWTDMPGDINTTHDHEYLEISVEFPKISSFPYIEDFNSGPAYWTASGNNPPDNDGAEFILDEFSYLNGNEGEGDSWYTEVSGSNTARRIWVESPVFDFSYLSNPVLSMDIKYQLGYSYYYPNYVKIEYSLDGENWTQLGNGNDPDWYNTTNSWYNNQSEPVDVWSNMSRDLCQLAGEPCVKFRIYARPYQEGERSYFAFDNFMIAGGISDDIEPIAITLPLAGECGTYTDSETVQVIVMNNLCRPLSDIPITLNVNGTDIATEIIPGPVPRFQSYIYTFTNTADLTNPGNNIITVTTSLATDLVPDNDSHTEVRFNNTPIAVSPGNYYEEDFNSGNAGWVSSVTSGADGTRCFVLGELPYLNGSQGNGDSWYVQTTTDANTSLFWVESPVFDLSATVDPILQMDIKSQLMYNYYSRAIFHVEYSLNGGANWTQLGNGNDPDWYNTTNWWTSNYDNPIEEWTMFQRKLCELKGESCVKIRIYGRAYWGPREPNASLVIQPDYSDRNYFAFDNFKIIDNPDIGITAFVAPPSIDMCLYPDPQEVTVTLYNWGCVDVHNAPVRLDITTPYGDILFEEIVPYPIPAGDYIDYTFTSGLIDMTPMGDYHFTAQTTMSPDANPTNDASYMSINVPFPIITNYPYHADFNDSPDFWIAGGDDISVADLLAGYSDRGRDFQWGELPYLNGPEGEGKSWYINSYDRNRTYKIWAESPVFDFSDLEAPFLLMDIKYQLAYNYYYPNYFRVQYSIDGGAWTTLGSGDDPDWYNTSNSWYNNYNDPIDEWTTVFRNLCDFAGEKCVKFRVWGQAYRIDDGAYFAFDNFRIIDDFQDASVSEFVTPIEDQAPCTFEEFQEVTVILKGASCEDLIGVPVFCDIYGPHGIEYNLSGTVDIPANTNNLTFTFPQLVDLRYVGDYEFDAYTDLIDDSFPDNDAIFQIVTTLDTLINTFPYYADFNDGTQYWRPGGGSDTRRFSHGEFDYLNGNQNNGDAWYVDVDEGNQNVFVWVESPVFDLSELENPILSFEIKYQLDYNYYYAGQYQVQYSTNGGNTWSRLGTSTSSPDWYKGHDHWWYNNHQNPVNEWTHVEHNLCELKGESCVKFRVYGRAYYGGVNVSKNLFAFDNVSITDPTIDAALVNVVGCYGTEYFLELEVENRDNFCAIFEDCNLDGGYALQFDNNNDRVELGELPELADFTVEHWLYNPANGVGDYRMSIVAQSNRFEITKRSSGQLHFYMPAIGSWQNTGAVLPVGQWTHVAITADAVQLLVYVNGEAIYSRSGNYSIPLSEWALGSRLDGTYPTNVALDEVRIWNKALTGEEIRLNICGTLIGDEDGLVAYYNMEDGIGSTTLTDITGNLYDGTLVNMDENTCWVASDIGENNSGVMVDPVVITDIDICYNLDGLVTCETYTVNINPGTSQTIYITDFLVPNGLELGTNLAIGGAASASHTYTGSSAAAAFNNDLFTEGWANTNTMPCWLQYDFGNGNEQAINAYRIFCSATQSPGSWASEARNPGVWQFQGSNNGVDWDVLDNVYYGNLSKNTWKAFKFVNDNPYRMYRMYNTYGEGGNSIHITELQMFYVDPEPSSLLVWIENPNGLTDYIQTNDTIYVNVANFPHCYDNCIAAIELVDEVTNASSNVNATPNPAEDPDFTFGDCENITLENTVWYKFNSNCYGKNVKVEFDDVICDISTAGIQISITRLLKEEISPGVWVDMEECVKENHEELFCYESMHGENNVIWEEFDLPPDSWYYITVDGEGGAACDFKIIIEGDMNELTYRTSQDGNWTDLNIWEIYMSTSDDWVPASQACIPHYPTSEDLIINVRHTVTFDSFIDVGVDELIIETDIVSTPKLIIPDGVEFILAFKEDKLPGEFDLENHGEIEIIGSMSFEPDASFKNEPGSIVQYSGTTQDVYQTVDGYYSLYVSGSVGIPTDNIKSLTENTVIHEELRFINGILRLGTFDLNVAENAVFTDDSETNGWIDATGEGYLICNLIDGNNIIQDFPVGGEYYSPASIDFNNITTAGTILCRIREEVHPQHAAAISRYWNIEQGSLVFNGTYEIKLIYHDSDLPGIPATVEEEEDMIEYAGIYSLNYTPDNWIYYLMEMGSYTADVATNTVTIIHDQFSDFTLLSSDNPLPVTWLFLTAAWNQNDGVITWATASEINNERFEIERCSGECLYFETIGFVDGAGNSSEINQYTFIDKNLRANPDDIFYYRIKQIDYDGAFDYSNIVELAKRDSESGVDGYEIISIYPNPVKQNEEVFIEIESDKNTKLSISLNDIIGKQVFLDELKLNKGKNIYILKTGMFSEGAYLIKLTSESQTEVRKLIISAK